MNSGKLTIYADYDVLENIALESKKFPKITAIFRRMANICLNISEDRLDDMQSISSEGAIDPVWQYIQDNDLPTPYALDSFFAQDDDVVYLYDPTAVFLLNKTEEQAKVLRERYGVLVVGEDEITDDFLQLNHKKKNGLNTKDVPFGMDSNGWNTIFHDVPMLNEKPLNAAVVSDNFLMKNRNGNDFCGTANLINLFDNILPPTLSIPFQILIICPDCPNLPNKVNDALNQFATDVNSLRDYPIEVEVCLTNKTPVHHRKLYTNYYSITCEKGFSMFKVRPGNIVREDGNDVRIESYYHDPIYTSGDTSREDAFGDLNILKDVFFREIHSNPQNRLLA